ncbi:hypothetical protein AF41_01689 [Citrobacter sp. MGH 55]|nr:hypothetical protein AF41_01689 [Citrobacter sp. MGH 55]
MHVGKASHPTKGTRANGIARGIPAITPMTAASTNSPDVNPFQTTGGLFSLSG